MSERLPKSEWSDGPWQTEPDEERWTDKATDLPCWIKRAPVTGALCGYVGVPKAHPAFGLPYDFFDVEDFDPTKPPPTLSIPGSEKMMAKLHDRRLREWEAVKDRRDAQRLVNEIKVHGGLTFADYWDGPDWWWFGFDCAHAGDQSPAMDAVLNSLGHRKASELRSWEEYRPISYVRAECEKLARQLADMVRTACSSTP